MSVWTDTSDTAALQLPLAFVLARCKRMGPVEMYMCIKAADAVKLGWGRLWLKKGRCCAA